MAIEIKSFRDEAKLLEADLKRIVHEFIEKETGRKVHSIELHGGRASIGAATVKFKFSDEE